jgi:SAM-dependent methyltransferase
MGVRPQDAIVAACEADLTRFGDNFRGVGWTRSEAEVLRRYRVMLELVRPETRPASLLDFGCGLGHLFELIRKEDHRGIDYTGLDLSERFLGAARARHPDAHFLRLDAVERPDELPEFDYIVMNGIFNYRGEVGYEAMLAYWMRLLEAVYPRARHGLAFNVMSKRVDWERDDLFHLPFDTAIDFVATRLSRHFVIRHDYGLYEYTCYVYRAPDTVTSVRGR